MTEIWKGICLIEEGLSSFLAVPIYATSLIASYIIEVHEKYFLLNLR